MRGAVLKSIARIEARLSEDPRLEKTSSEEGPRDLLFVRRVVSWVGRLSPSPSESLLLAAWGHVLDRWTLPRDSQPQKYPMTTAGYHKWRKALNLISADATSKILSEEGVDEKAISRVRDLILKKNFPSDPDSQSLEDADCLAFLELKLEGYLEEWDEAKTVRILRGTLEKMTPRAREMAARIPLPEKAVALLKKASP
ncbi:MAG TPA: DUF4202 domain-containing protein [bacterium]|nr:DUF4202 domain-containing protein [bacterium]